MTISFIGIARLFLGIARLFLGISRRPFIGVLRFLLAGHDFNVMTLRHVENMF